MADVKKSINRALGQVFYSDAQQMRIHSYKGKILEDSKTLEENEVSHNSFLIVIFFEVPIGNLVFSPILPLQFHLELDSLPQKS